MRLSVITPALQKRESDARLPWLHGPGERVQKITRNLLDRAIG